MLAERRTKRLAVIAICDDPGLTCKLSITAYTFARRAAS